MKLIITESRLNSIAMKWLNENYGDLKPFETEKYPNLIFYRKDDEVIFEYNKKNGDVYVNYKEIWSFLASMFSKEYNQIQDITKEWVEEHYKLRVTTTEWVKYSRSALVEEHYKLRVTTTHRSILLDLNRWRNITN